MTGLPDEVLADLTKKLTEEEAAKRALAIFRLTTEKVLTKLKQSVLGDVTESTKATVMQLTQALGEKLVRLAEGWNKDLQDDLVIYPEGTRFVRRRINSQVFVLEQKPQIRTLAFRGDLMDGGIMLPPTAKALNAAQHYPLALPYVIFVLYFTGTTFQNLWVGFRNQPLTQVGQKVGRPALPNIDAGLNVCVGGEFKENAQLAGKTVSEQINSILSVFWQSTFNKDISDEFHRMRKLHPGMADLETWAQSSREDPLFILGIPWQEDVCLKKLLDKVGAARPNIAQQLQEEVLAVVNTVQTKLTKALEAVKIGTIRPGELSKQFAVVLQDILKEAYQECWHYCQDKLAEEQKRLHHDLDAVVQEQVYQVLLKKGSTPPW